jgi:hypothetical protein
MLGRILSTGIIEGSLRDCEVEQVATAITGMLEGLQLQALTMDINIESITQAALQLAKGLWSR